MKVKDQHDRSRCKRSRETGSLCTGRSQNPRIVNQRTVEAQKALTIIRARNIPVRMRVAAINAVRGLVKPCGHRVPACSTGCFAQRSLAALPLNAADEALDRGVNLCDDLQCIARVSGRFSLTEHRSLRSPAAVSNLGRITRSDTYKTCKTGFDGFVQKSRSRQSAHGIADQSDDLG